MEPFCFACKSSAVVFRFRALRSIVVCFLEAVPLLVSVAAMLFFFLFIFAGECCDNQDTFCESITWYSVRLHAQASSAAAQQRATASQASAQSTYPHELGMAVH
jgi:hypothetical protein